MADPRQPLVTADWLQDRLGDPNLAILDVRLRAGADGRADFETGHIPGAIFTDYARDGWRAAKGSAVGMLPEANALAQLFGRLGLTPDQHVVVVPTGVNTSDFSAAARVYWTLKAAGHERLSLLDGGWSGWQADSSRPVERGAARQPEPTSYPVRIDGRLRATLDEVERALEKGSAVLLDARSASYFEGREKSPQAARPGRLPGARLLNQAEAYDAAANRLKPIPELGRLFDGLQGMPVISYCNTGQAAATNWFVLAELLGHPDIRLYDGSMTEWTQDETRPVETGPAT